MHYFLQEIELLVKDLNFVPGFIFKKDVTLTDFLNRVGLSREKESSELSTHPWLNLFVPKSRIMDINAGVFNDIFLRHNQIAGPILFYPLLRQKYVLQTLFFFFLNMVYSPFLT